MANYIYILFLLILFIWLFIRDCQLDRKRDLKQNRKGNLHALKEFHKHFKENGIVTEHDFEKEIKLLEDQNFEVSVIDYFTFKKSWRYRKD